MEQCSFTSSPCRLCLRSCDLQTQIFGKIGQKLGIHFKIKACFPSLHVDPDDGLPDSICYRCLCSLDQTYSFWTKCCSSEARLSNIAVKRKYKKNYNWVSPKKTMINPYEVENRETPIDFEDYEVDDWCIWDARYRICKNEIYPSQSNSLMACRQEVKRSTPRKMVLCDKTTMKQHQVENGETSLDSELFEFDDWDAWDARYRISKTHEYPYQSQHLETYRQDREREVPNKLIRIDEVADQSRCALKSHRKSLPWEQEAYAKGRDYTPATRACSGTSVKGIPKSVVPTASGNFAAKFWMQKPFTCTNKTGLIHERKPMHPPPLMSNNIFSRELGTEAQRKVVGREKPQTMVTKKLMYGTNILPENENKKRSCSLGDHMTPSSRKINMLPPSQCNQMFTCARSVFDRLRTNVSNS